MKKCNVCGTQTEDQTKFCAACGSSDFSVTESEIVNSAQDVSELETGHGNIIAGIVGAFLFSLIGGLLYFVVYQIGIIAGICGLVIFVLANFGYGLFAKTKNKASLVALIVSIVSMIVMIFLAEYFCLSFEIFRVFIKIGSVSIYILR